MTSIQICMKTQICIIIVKFVWTLVTKRRARRFNDKDLICILPCEETSTMQPIKMYYQHLRCTKKTKNIYFYFITLPKSETFS